MRTQSVQRGKEGSKEEKGVKKNKEDMCLPSANFDLSTLVKYALIKPFSGSVQCENRPPFPALRSFKVITKEL
jgi:hypothetical protein